MDNRKMIYLDDALEVIRKLPNAGIHWFVSAEAVFNALLKLPPAQPEITDGQAIEHLQESGWMQNHDKQMYEMGLREQLADDSDSYDALLPSAQPEWIPVDKELPKDGMKCLVTQKFGKVRHVSKATYACDLYKVNQYDFYDKKNTAGFYYFDDEYGYVEALGVTAWMPEPEPWEG